MLIYIHALVLHNIIQCCLAFIVNVIPFGDSCLHLCILPFIYDPTNALVWIFSRHYLHVHNTLATVLTLI
jgi:hypothetical protein